MQNKPGFFFKFLSFTSLALVFTLSFLIVKPYGNVKPASAYSYPLPTPPSSVSAQCGTCQPGYACSCSEWLFDWENNVAPPGSCACEFVSPGQEPCVHTICPVNTSCYDPGDGDATYCLPNENPTPNPTSGGGGGSTPTPIPLALSCLDVKAYTQAFVLHTPTTLSALRAGDTVNFCVRGSANLGTFIKARFTINGVLRPETTTIRPGTTSEFCDLYTVPANTFNFTVSGQIQHSTGVVVN